MRAKATEEQELYILEVTGRKSRFVKVKGVPVDLANEIKGFGYNWSEPDEVPEIWTVFDVVSGRRLSRPHGLLDEAIRQVNGDIEGAAAGAYKRQQDLSLDRYGRSPAVKVDDIEVIQEPREPEVIPKCL